jgi:ribosomal protein L14E/L6E/L27E
MKRLCVRRRYGLVLGKDARKRVVIIKAVDFNQNVMRGVNDSG